MKLWNKAVIGLAVVSLFAVTACKKEPEKSADPGVAQQAAPLMAKTWDKSVVNGLLEYVPADTAFVSATTRQLSIDSPEMKALFGKINKLTTDVDKLLETDAVKGELGADAEAVKSSMKATKNIKDLLSDYPKFAADFGLDPEGHFDSIAYMNGNTIVGKFTIADMEKYRTKVISTWDEMFKAAADENDPATKIEPKEVTAGGEKWLVYPVKNLRTVDDCAVCKVMPNALAVNFGKDIATYAFVDENDTASLENLLKPVDNSLKADALGKLADDTSALGYIDNVKLFQLMTSDAGKALLKDMDITSELTPECSAYYLDVVKKFPKTSFDVHLGKDGKISSAMTVVMTDKAELQKIQGLHTQSLKVANDSSLAAVSFNLNFQNTITYLTEKAASFAASDVKCEDVKTYATMLQEGVKSLQDPQVAMFTTGISGLNVALDKFDSATKSFEAVANITGPTVGVTLPLLFNLVKAASPKLKTIDLKKDEVVAIDLTEMAGMPLKLNAYLTDTDLVAGTAKYDVKAIAGGEKKINNDFISLYVSMALAALLDAKIPDVFRDMAYGISFGTNDDGIAVNFVFNE